MVSIGARRRTMSDDLISRSALLDDIQAAVDIGGMGGMVAGALKRYVKRGPAVDAVIPVRCAQCKHFKRNLENDTYCSSVNGLTDPEEDDFCSYGERMDDHETD